jgi:hypothetical protein
VKDVLVARVVDAGCRQWDVEADLGKLTCHQVVRVIAGDRRKPVGLLDPGVDKRTKVTAVAVDDQRLSPFRQRLDTILPFLHLQ